MVSFDFNTFSARLD